MSGLKRREGIAAQSEGVFRLGRYEITRKTTGQIVWKTAPGPNTVSKGTCTVSEDILFIGPRESTESNLIGRRFAKNLGQLPKWDQTGYYCAKSSLCVCRSFNNAQEERRRWLRNREPTGKHDPTEKLSKATRRKPAGLETLRRQALISSRLAAKSFIHLTEALRLVISFSSAGSIRFCKEIKRRWHLKKGKRSSVHHPEDQM
jgi:hypothetical protein